MITVGEVGRWLRRPSGAFAAVYLTLGPLFLVGALGVAGSLWYLATGDVRGGRPTAVGLLLYGATSTAVAVAGLRRSGRMLHVLLGVLLLVPLNRVDAFVTHHGDPRLPGFPLLLLAGLLYNLARFTRAERRPPVAEASVPTP